MANGNPFVWSNARWQAASAVIQVATIFFLIVGFFVTVRLEQERLTALEMVVNGTLSKAEAEEMLKTSESIHSNLQKQIDILAAREAVTESRLYDLTRKVR